LTKIRNPKLQSTGIRVQRSSKWHIGFQEHEFLISGKRGSNWSEWKKIFQEHLIWSSGVWGNEPHIHQEPGSSARVKKIILVQENNKKYLVIKNLFSSYLIGDFISPTLDGNQYMFFCMTHGSLWSCSKSMIIENQKFDEILHRCTPCDLYVQGTRWCTISSSCQELVELLSKYYSTI
jgi:hypothetical protein